MITLVFALLVAIMHCYIFFLESLAWGKSRTNKAFAVSKADAEACRSFAFNQGFYNLFLAIAIFAGLAWARIGADPRGQVLVDYGALSVVGAGAVLFFSAPKLRRAGLMQAGPAILYFAARLLSS